MLPTFIDQLMYYEGTRDDAVGSGIALQAERSWVRLHNPTGHDMALLLPKWVPGTVFIIYNGGYQEYFLGCKRGRCLGLTSLPPACNDCLEIWEPQSPGIL
jgi:hypothetical protein